MAGDHRCREILLGAPDEIDLRSEVQRRVISLKEKPAQVETLHISDELNIDLAPDGTVYGIELLNANAQLSTGNGGEIIIVNEASGQSSKVKLAV
jgi:uncharacterized protein YuzE